MMSEQSLKRVLLVNAFEFRRACMHHFLAPWASEECLELISLPPPEAHERMAQDNTFAMLIYDAGSSYIPFHKRLAEIQVLRTLCPNTPMAVFSDYEDPGEVAATLDIGVQAYFHNAVSPELAFRALSFVVRGGTYFSPSAMVAAYHRLSCGPRLPPRVAAALPDASADGQSPGGEALQPPQEEGSTNSQHPPVVPAGERQEIHDAGFGRVVQLSAHPGKAEKSRTNSLLLTERQQAVLQHLCQGDPNKMIAKKLNLTETTVKVHVREIMRKLGVFNRTQVAVAVGRSSAEPGEASEESVG
jgi:DNA-binding NarL/FixJ family response regulator